MNIVDIAARRFTTKAYDAQRTLSQHQQQAIFSLLQNSPSSLNLQPWHFHIITSNAVKQTIDPAIYELNSEKVADAPMVIVFSTLNRLDDAQFKRVLEQEKQDGRFRDPQSQQKFDQGRRGYVAAYISDEQQQRGWMERQAYIALGFLLLGVAAMDLQATPIEGFDPEKMDKALNLDAQGLHSVVVATVGYNNAQDFNASLPKSRLEQSQIITRL